MANKDLEEWTIRVKLPIFAKEWLEQRAKKRGRSIQSEVRAMVGFEMACDKSNAETEAVMARFKERTKTPNACKLHLVSVKRA